MMRDHVSSAGAGGSRIALVWCLLVAGGAVVWPAGIVPAMAAANDAQVSIEGGADEEDPSGHNYTWTVTNHHASPIVSVEIPHYRADTFTAPKGWKTECTYLVGIGVPDKPGVCRAMPESPGAGLVRGASAEFRMRIAGGGTTPQPGRGRVLVRFADGSETAVEGVEVPQAPAASTRYIPLIGLAAIFAAVVAVREYRRRKTRPVPPA